MTRPKHNARVPRLCLLLLFAALLGPPGRAQTASRPVITPDAPVLRLDDLGLYGAGLRLRGDPADTPLPTGWTGGFEPAFHGVACQPAGTQNGRDAWLLHCPWQGGTGVAFQEYTVRLPRAAKITLTGATALRADAVGKSDGVTFRVFACGRPLLNENRTDGAWRDFRFDLTPLAGQTVTLRFETDPGPKDDASFDFALWGERRLTLAGFRAVAVRRPAPPPLDLRRLSSVTGGGVAPRSGWAGRTSVRVTPRGAVLRYAGADGTLEYHWTPPASASDPVLGRWVLHAHMTGDAPVDVPLAGGARVEWAVPAVAKGPTPPPSLGHPSRSGRGDGAWGGEALLSSSAPAVSDTALDKPVKAPAVCVVPPPETGGVARSAGVGSGSSITLARTFTVGGQTATLTVTAHLAGKSLVLDVACDKPVIRALDGGGWGPTLRRKALGVPYYSNPVTYLPRENLFTGALLDWTRSAASGQSGTRAAYDARTDGTRRALKETLVYTAAWHLDECLPNIPNPPSPFRAELGGRVVLDIWGGAFATLADRLRALNDEGIGPGVALVHDWQRSGYDNALPAHVPANPNLGGDPAMAALVREGEKDNIRMALHENYVDYYPNWEGFTGADIALDPAGRRVGAWYNPGTKVQSFAVKPTRILPLAQTQSPETVKRYNSDACYLDVHSAVPPWFHVDFDASQPGAGAFGTVWDAHRDLWAYERRLHHGPVFGEGNNHWYWSGLLDGVEAQFGQGWRDGQGTTAPLMTDFDLLKIHPLQLNHGMGYYERWWDRGPGAGRSLLSLLDQYRMQEVAFGHEGFLGGDAWHDPALAWLETRLMTPLTAKTATARVVGIDYGVGGRWADASAVVRAGGDFSRVRVRWDNGVTVWAGGASSAGGPLPPRFGWWAEGPGLRAGTTLRQGVVSDFADTGDGVFANARPATDWQNPGQALLRPAVEGFTPTGPRTFRASYAWSVGRTPQFDAGCFVHFVREGPDAPNEGIRFQQDHALATPTSRWRAGETVKDGPWDIAVPAGVAPGDYVWALGLSQPGGGRVALQGTADAHGRTVLGTLHVGAGGAVAFTPAPAPAAERNAPINAPVNGIVRVLDFGPIRTNGSAWVRREGRDWVLRPFPRDRAFTLELSAGRFGRPRVISSDGGASVTVNPAGAGAFWRLPLNGAKTYRWAAARQSVSVAASRASVRPSGRRASRPRSQAT